ncbi:glutathione S-transferase family protein [Acidisphaera sp. L21]|uniref:glutathione S-transferase family protein n=1 Tax=Acidisphaera sp. L21 TaxID=1641851 RepID=UPI00131E2AA7|nr:glutathione S-transferase family protein [Acidisphaera sp. L21]
MAQYRLHYFPESGNSYKLALMLSLCGQTFEPVWTDFGAGITRTAEWRSSVNQMGEIPVLEENGVTLTQTAPILLRLADIHGRLHPITETERFEVLRWLFWDNHKMSSNMATYRFRRAFTEAPDQHIQSYIRGRVDDALAILEQQVKDRPFVIGDRVTVADISICGYLSFPPDESGYDLAATHPAIHAWLQRIAALPGWRPPYDLMPGKRLTRYG